VNQASVFRQEAVQAIEVGEGHGAPLHLLPGWTKVAYWLLVAIVVGGIVYSSLAFVSDYAEGPAVVRVEGRFDLTTSTGGTAMDVAVKQGDHVREGQVLVRFYTGLEQQDLDHVNREFELMLVRLLQDANNDAARQGLASLRAERELAAARLRARTVVAPRSGVITNLRIRPGQSLSPGEIVASLVDESAASYSVVALVPGQLRPMLVVGMPMRFSLVGYPHVYQNLVIDSIGNEVIGPTEVRRYLGEEVGDALPVQGSLVLVRAHLQQRTFMYDGKTYDYYDGIPGMIDAKVRSTRLIIMLVPALREVLQNGSRT
jgi:multidrug efflux pump subunit AcrA (membrane-fusion protein)